MRIRRVRIENFTSFQAEEIFLAQFNAFVGPNNAGKSNILRALDFALNPDFARRSDAITKYLYWNGDASIPISVIVTYGDLSEDEITVFGADNLEPGDSEGRVLEGSEEASVLDQNHLYLRITTTCRYDQDNDEHNVVTFFSKYGEDAPVSRQQKRQIGFTYLRGEQSAVALLGLGTNSVLRRLVSESGGSLAPQIEALSNQLRAADDLLRENERFESLRTELSRKLAALIPMTLSERAELSYLLPSWAEDSLLRTLVPGFQAAESPLQLPIILHGRGVTAIAAIVSMLFYKQYGTGSAILAVEEPETALHPQLQRALLENLTASAVQVLITTHSPVIAATLSAPAIQIVQKRDGQSRVRRVEIQGNETVNRFVELHLREKFAECLFSDVVLLVEGETDEAALTYSNSRLAARGAVKEWGFLNVSVLPVGGVTNIPDFARTFGALGIKAIALYDSDPNRQNIPVEDIESTCISSVCWPHHDHLFDMEGAIFAEGDLRGLINALSSVSAGARIRPGQLVGLFTGILRDVNADVFAAAQDILEAQRVASLTEMIVQLLIQKPEAEDTCRSAMKVVFKQRLSSPRYIRQMLIELNDPDIPPRLARMVAFLNRLLTGELADSHGPLSD